MMGWISLSVDSPFGVGGIWCICALCFHCPSIVHLKTGVPGFESGSCAATTPQWFIYIAVAPTETYTDKMWTEWVEICISLCLGCSTLPNMIIVPHCIDLGLGQFQHIMLPMPKYEPDNFSSHIKRSFFVLWRLWWLSHKRAYLGCWTHLIVLLQ